MNVLINGKNYSFNKSKSLDQLLVEFEVRMELGYAVALNSTVITKAELNKTFVKDGDRVEIIQATTGG